MPKFWIFLYIADKVKKLSIMTFIFDPFYVDVRFHFGVKDSLSVLKPQACNFIKKRLQNRSLLRSNKGKNWNYGEHWHGMGEWEQANIWVKVYKNGPSKIRGRQPLKNLKWYGLPKLIISSQSFLKAVFHKFYLVRSWIP